MPESKIRLDDWYFMNGGIHGTVYNHPHLRDGTDIRLGTIIDLDFQTHEVTTELGQYVLGKERHAGTGVRLGDDGFKPPL